MIKIVNIYKEKNNIYCGRGSALGNPFVLENENMRDYVCDEYELYFKFEVKLKKNPAMLRQLELIENAARNGDINLGCFCAPKRCHCETIKNYIETKLQTR